jgi:hypothetical protein
VVAARASGTPPLHLLPGKPALVLDVAMKHLDALRANVETWRDLGEGTDFPATRRADLSAAKRVVG